MNTLVLSGGGMRGIFLLGSLHYYYTETDTLHAISTYSGTSIGAVICVLLAVGYTPFEIFQKVHMVKDLLNFELQDLIACKDRYGLKSITPIIDVVMRLVHARYPDLHTLGDVLQATARHMYVCVTNLSREQVVYLNSRDHPDVPLELALRMSCNLPGMFSKIENNGEYMVDGGVIDNTPISPVDHPGTRALVMRLAYDPFHPDTGSFLEYMYRCISVGSKHKFKNDLEHFTGHIDVLNIVDNNSSAVDFGLTLSHARKQFDSGYNQAFNHDLLNELDID